MSHRFLKLTVGVFMIGAGVAVGPAANVAGQSLKRTVHVAVTDKAGATITDMRADEFELKYAGKAAEISDVKIATTPVRVALVIADRGTGMFQAGTLHFVNALLSKGEFSITGVVTQPERFADYSSDVSVLKPAVIQLQRRSTSQGGAQLVDAILTAAKEVKKEGFRPVIVVMRAGGEAPTPTRSETVREEIRKSGAVLYAISRTGTQSMGGGQSATSAPTAADVSRANSESEIREGQLTLGAILGEGSRDSGGRHVQTVAPSIEDLVKQIASEIGNRYEITYTIPQAGRPNDKLEVSTKRNGVTLLAPIRVPN
jgi:VWFA-related protein